MTCDYIFKNEIHPEQHNPWVTQYKNTDTNIMVVHPAALIPFLIKMSNIPKLIAYVDQNVFNPLKYGKEKFSVLTIDDNDIAEAFNQRK